MRCDGRGEWIFYVVSLVPATLLSSLLYSVHARRYYWGEWNLHSIWCAPAFLEKALFPFCAFCAQYPFRDSRKDGKIKHKFPAERRLEKSASNGNAPSLKDRNIHLSYSIAFFCLAHPLRGLFFSSTVHGGCIPSAQLLFRNDESKKMRKENAISCIPNRMHSTSAQFPSIWFPFNFYLPHFHFEWIFPWEDVVNAFMFCVYFHRFNYIVLDDCDGPSEIVIKFNFHQHFVAVARLVAGVCGIVSLAFRSNSNIIQYLWRVVARLISIFINNANDHLFCCHESWGPAFPPFDGEQLKMRSDTNAIS